MRTALLLAGLLAGSIATADPTVMHGGPERVQVVELFTSEGCHSCPPADRWMSELKDDPRLWRRIVPVAFHVDYWDYIGWRDRFGSPAHTLRQRGHARQGNVRAVYTPGFVVDGREWRAWYSRSPLPAPRGAPGRLSARIDGTDVTVRFEPAQATDAPLEVYAARLVFNQASSVTDGENSGKLLRHDFVVSTWSRAPLAAEAGANALGAALELPPARHDSAIEALAVWITEPGRQRPLQAAGGFIDR